MRSRFPFLRSLLGAALLCTALGGCGFGRNVADDCWIDAGNMQSSENYLTGLRQRNVPVQDPTRLAAGDRITRSRKALRACHDDVPGQGRPPIGAQAAGEGEGAHGA